MKSFPIVKIDRTTAQEILPLFINKGIFSNYDTLRRKEDILEGLKYELGVDELTPEQSREVLSKEKKYKTNNYVVRDYGEYVIAFSASLYSDYSPEGIVENALDKIRLHKLGHKIATIILSEAYLQKQFEGLTISKERLIQYLGYSPDDKYIYSDISEVMFSLRWLNYQIFKFKNKFSEKVQSKAVGNFIYNLEDDGKNFKLWINRCFFGCIEHLLINDATRTDAEKKELFRGGYYSYPTALLPCTKDYSTPAYLLSHFLILDSGNAKLKEKGHKVIAYKLERFIQEARISYSKASDQVKEVLNSLSEIKIVQNIEPGLDQLRNLKPRDAINTLVYVQVKSSIKDIDHDLRSTLE